MSIDPAAQLRHELRTPLNHIIGYAEMLLEELQDGHKPDLAAGLAALRADARHSRDRAHRACHGRGP